MTPIDQVMHSKGLKDWTPSIDEIKSLLSDRVPDPDRDNRS